MTQPKNTLFIRLRLDGDAQQGRTIPLNLLPQLPAIIQAELFSAQADQLVAEELNAEILAAIPTPETSR